MRCGQIILCVFLLLFSGCVNATTPDIDLDVKVPEQTKEHSIQNNVSSVEDTRTPDITPVIQEVTQDRDELQRKIEDELGFMQGALTRLSETARIWPDTSLGCPEPGMVYAQVLTDGWLVVFETPDGKNIQVHTERGFENYVICTKEFNTETEEEIGDSDALLVQYTAKQYLAETLEVPITRIDLISVEGKLWSNSCLGCAKPEENCLMVITPGYKVQLAVDGHGYAVHTNDDASANRICDKDVSLTPGRD